MDGDVARRLPSDLAPELANLGRSSSQASRQLGRA